jgi:hypothetical protein
MEDADEPVAELPEGGVVGDAATLGIQRFPSRRLLTHRPLPAPNLPDTSGLGEPH